MLIANAFVGCAGKSAKNEVESRLGICVVCDKHNKKKGGGRDRLDGRLPRIRAALFLVLFTLVTGARHWCARGGK